MLYLRCTATLSMMALLPLASAQFGKKDDAVANRNRFMFHSFEPPYREYEQARGNRIVSGDWKSGGVTQVNENFVRLTPDRQSKTGSLWSKRALFTDTTSSILKFRISGQGERFFGDGMAVWLTTRAHHTPGSFHGYTEQFVGIGIIFDTFKNTEKLHLHRDVTVVWNDGTRGADDMLADAVGCDADLRYHEARADFSVLSASRARFTVEKGTSLVIEIDARDTGEWVECATLAIPEAMQGSGGGQWLKDSHIGLTASTGGVADNHDVIALETFGDLQLHREQAEANGSSGGGGGGFAGRYYSRGQGVEPDRLERVEAALEAMLERLARLERQIEHGVEGIETWIDKTGASLRDREDLNDARIAAIVERVESKTQQSLGARIDAADRRIKQRVDGHVDGQTEAAMARAGVVLDQMSQGTGSWKMPFFLLLLPNFLFAGFGAVYYSKLRKQQLL